MEVVVTVLSLLVGLLVTAAIVVNLRALRAARALPALSSTAPDLKDWPKVSLVVAACNEAEGIGEAAKTLLEMDYPNLELIIVDDRSTDGTTEIVDELAAADPRVKALHIHELPDGWLGKLYAMHRGTEIADGEFLVFTDADVHFGPTMLRRAVTLCEREDLGHLGVLPMTRGGTFWTDVAIASFATGFLNSVDLKAQGREGLDKASGVGAFGMVRRRDFDKTPGWPWLKMEILDDLGLATMMVSKGGAKTRVVTGKGQLSLNWYPDLPSLIRGLEKNGFAGLADFKLWRAAVITFVLPAITVSVLAAPLSSILWLQALGALFALSLIAAAFQFHQTIGHPRLAAFMSFLAFPIMSWAILGSTIITLRRGGINWRGTHYAIDELRAGKRVHI